MDLGDLTALDARTIAERVHEGWSSAVDVARAHLARIAGDDGRIGAFVSVDPEQVLAAARHVDNRPDRFALPLAGVPVAVQDRVDVSGHPTRHGSAATSERPARRDDELVKRLRAAGAVIVGKTRTPELGVRGAARDPHDGSGAAAVAARMAALALGTDGDGAIRVPAAHRGLVGLKPGTGVVPLPGRAAEHWCGMTEAGPIARTAGDAAVLLGVLRGERLDLDGRPGPVRVALSLADPFPFGRLHADHRAAAIGAAARLRAGPDGAVVVLADPPYPRTLALRWARRRQVGVAREVAALELDPDALERRTAAVARRGRRVLRTAPPRDAGAAGWRDEVVGWLDDGGFDLLLGPATAGPAGDRSAASFARAWNVAGLPAAVAPVRVGDRSVGVQLVGRPGSEALLLAAAARLEHRVVPTAGAAARRSYA